MSKFARSGTRPAARGPVRTTGTATTTFEGAPAVARDHKSDLFMLAVANMVGEDTFYEGASARDERFRNLVHLVAVEDFDWLYRFAGFLRTKMFMRSASIVLAAEAVRARLVRTRSIEDRFDEPRHTNRQMVDTVIRRLDEPGEFLAYWASRYGRNFPVPVKRGVADAMARLTDEYSAMKYDGTAGAWRLGDVVDLTHPTPKGQWQGDLFRYLLDRRHHAGEIRVGLDRLPTIAKRRFLESIPRAERRAWFVNSLGHGLVAGELAAAGATWEWLGGWLGEMDAKAWEAVIPSMGYMALLRNLRNFDQAGVSASVLDDVERRLATPEAVAKSMQFPFRFYSAHQAAGGSQNWGKALSRALDLATSNVPEFKGRTLVLTDTSASMRGMTMSARSKMTPEVMAAVFAAAVAKRNAGRVDLVQFASSAAKVDFRPGESVLTLVDRMHGLCGTVGHGTDLNAGLRHYSGHDRVIVFSDMQIADRATWPSAPRKYAWNLGGYEGSPNYDGSIVELAGMSDAAFRLVPMIESGRDADWPF